VKAQAKKTPPKMKVCLACWHGLGTEVCIAAFFKVPSPMEDLMCWEMDYKFFAGQKKAQESRIGEEQRAGVIHNLLNEANKQGESTNGEGTQVKEVAPAK
jgi:hypothetical protein